MKTTNLTPYKFSDKGIKTLLKGLKKSNDWKALVENHCLINNVLSETSLVAYFEDATRDDKSTVWFNEDTQDFLIGAHFETGSWSNNLQLHSFTFEDFEYKVMDLE